MEDLKYTIYIGGTPEQVWEALVSPEGTRAIFFGSVLESTFEVGAPYAYVGPGNNGDETVHVYGTVLAFEPYRLMSYTEHAGPTYRENHAEFETRITMELEPMGASTKVTFVNDRWPEGHPSYESTQQSWPLILSNIKSYVETGKTLDLGW